MACVMAAAGRADIRIATVGPVTGPLAALGEQMLTGARQAVADINAAGGVLGQKLVLEIGDDQCDPKQAVAVANRMVAKGVVFVAGHFCSGASIPAAKVYDEEGVIMISPASTSPKLTDEGGPRVFRVCGRDDQQGGVLGRFLARRFAGRRIALVHDKSAYGKGLAEETRRALRGAGQQEAMFEAYTAGEKDYTALVSKLKAARIEVLFVGGYHTEAGLILRQMRAQGLAATLVGGDTLVVQDYWSIAGKAGAGTLFSFAPDAAKGAGRRGDRGALPGQGRRALGLCALHLCRGAGLGPGGREGRRRRSGQGDGGARRCGSRPPSLNRKRCRPAGIRPFEHRHLPLQRKTMTGDPATS